MPAPLPTREEYHRALLALLPRGPVWSRDPSGVLARVMNALVPTILRNHDRANYLLRDAFPASTTELLPEWEATLGLPDPCAGLAPTLQLRRAMVAAKLAARGGQSVPYIVAFAASLGYDITVTEFAPFAAGSSIGRAIAGPEWAHVWQVNTVLTTYSVFRAGESVAGDPLTSFGNEILECQLAELVPAHTILLFAYT